MKLWFAAPLTALTGRMGGLNTTCLLALVVTNLGIANSAMASERYTSYSGTARMQKSSGSETGQFLYQEQHWLKWVDGKLRERVVLYSCQNQAAFARKIMQINGNALVPEFDLHDQRTGYREGLRMEKNQLSVYSQINSKKAMQTDNIDAGVERLVADAGFDQFVREQWDVLLSGKSVKLNFVVPGELDYLGFKLTWKHSSVVNNTPAQVFQLAPSGVLGWIVSGIEVSYSDKERRLLHFSGLSNIRDLRGNNYRADIEFPEQTANLAADANSFMQAKSKALVDRCD